MDAGREFFFNFGVEAHFMADMGDESPAGFDLGDDLKGFGKGVVREVLFFSQCVDNQNINTSYLI